MVSEPVSVFISVSEASKRFGYTRGAIYNMTKSKKINFRNLEDGLYVSAEDLQKRAEVNKSRIKSNKKVKKQKKTAVSENYVKKTETTDFQTGVLILAGLIGIVLGYAITTLLR